jgi:hypothetical protein
MDEIKLRFPTFNLEGKVVIKGEELLQVSSM